jgi:hypothetical protein
MTKRSSKRKFQLWQERCVYIYLVLACSLNSITCMIKYSENPNLTTALRHFKLHEVYQPEFLAKQLFETRPCPEVTLPPHRYTWTQRTQKPLPGSPFILKSKPRTLEPLQNPWVDCHYLHPMKPYALVGQQLQSARHPLKRWLAFTKLIRMEAIKLMRSLRREAKTKAAVLTVGIGVLTWVTARRLTTLNMRYVIWDM